MASPNPNQYPYQGWTSQNYQQPLAQRPGNRYSQSYPVHQPYHAQYEPQHAPYVQPYYGDTSRTPIIAELPASLPPAPPTTTSDQQLKDDALFAHKMQNLEVAEVRQRSSSAVSFHRRPISMAPPGPQTESPLLHQVSLRACLQSIAHLGVQLPSVSSQVCSIPVCQAPCQKLS
jgi:hypothetical protein